jgi:bacterioferritin-associated ferredoxin
MRCPEIVKPVGAEVPSTSKEMVMVVMFGGVCGVCVSEIQRGEPI